MSEITDKTIFILVRLGLAMYLLYFFYIYNYSLDYLIETSTQFTEIAGSNFSDYFELCKNTVRLATLFGMLFSVFLIFGFLIRISCLILWICLLISFNANQLIAQLYYSYIAITLACFVLFNEQKLFCLNVNFFKNKMTEGPWRLVFGKLFYMTVFVSGCSKVFVNEWRSGTILKHLCDQFFLKDYTNYCNSPEYVFNFLTYTALFIELTSIFFLLKKFRFIVWILNIILQIGIIFFLPVHNISVAIILVQLFIFHSSLFKEDLLYKKLCFYIPKSDSVKRR